MQRLVVGMSVLALKATILTLLVALSTLVLTDIEVVLALVAPAPLLLIAVGGTHVARRLSTAWAGPRPVPVRVIRRPGPIGRGSL